MPSAVQADLTSAAQAHKSVELDQVSYTGNVSTSEVDMTPRTGDSSQTRSSRCPAASLRPSRRRSPPSRGDVDAPASGPGGRALYLGLTRTTFSTAPVIIVSSGLDLSNPDNFRSLQWSVPAAEIVAEVKSSDDLPALHGPVIFVLVPTAGGQPQLGQQQKNYIEGVWTALLKAAGATSVTFVDADSSRSRGQRAERARGPGAEPAGHQDPGAAPANGKFSCTVTDSFFSFEDRTWPIPRQIEQDLAPCVDGGPRRPRDLRARRVGLLRGPAQRRGPAARQRALERQQLSVQRVETIARSAGRLLQAYPSPTSPAWPGTATSISPTPIRGAPPTGSWSSPTPSSD